MKFRWEGALSLSLRVKPVCVIVWTCEMCFIFEASFVPLFA